MNHANLRCFSPCGLTEVGWNLCKYRKFPACLPFCWYVLKICKFDKYVSKKWLKDGKKITPPRGQRV